MSSKSFVSHGIPSSGQRVSVMEVHVTLGLLASLMLVSCNPSAAAPAEGEKATIVSQSRQGTMAPLNVKVKELTPRSMTEKVVIAGETKAEALITYAAETPGQVEHLGVSLGQTVRTGQVLARIDYESLKARLDQAEARHRFVKLTNQRLLALKKEDLVTQEQLDSSESDLAMAEAQLKMANADFKKSTIRAKRSGVVTKKYIEAGEYVGPGAPVVQVVNYQTLFVEGQIPEAEVAMVQPGKPVRVLIPALARELEGKVQMVLPVAEEMSKTFRVRVRVANPQLQIKVGMAAQIQISTRTHRNVILAVQDAVLEEGAARSVFVAQQGVAKKRHVRLGPMEGDQVILLEGIQPGEQLVVLGQRSLKDGQPVRIIQ